MTPADHHIIRTSDFLRVDSGGKLDFARSCQVLADLAKVCAGKDVHFALLDVRDVHGQMTTTELYQLAKEFAKTGFRKSDRLAVLHPYSGQLADTFAMFAEERGMTVRAFDDYEEAIKWFSTELPAN